jgi:hypothetical protein
MRDEYRDRAAECLRVAHETNNPAHRQVLLEMALAWLRLVDQAERNGQADLSYETPPPRSVSQPIQQQQQRAKSDK